MKHKTLLITILSLLLSGCTAVLLSRSNQSTNQTKITIEQTPQLSTLHCGIYQPLPFPETKSVEDSIQNLDELEHNHDGLIDVLLEYIKNNNDIIDDYKRRNQAHYQDYLTECLINSRKSSNSPIIK